MRKIIVGFLASIGLFTIILALFLSWNFYQLVKLVGGEADTTQSLTPNTVLKVSLGAQQLNDSPSNRNFILDIISKKPLSLFEAVYALDKAAQDDRIKGVFLDFQGSALPISQAQELRRVLLKLHAQGKFIYAYAHSFGEASNGTSIYYLATCANKIFMQPQGLVGITGYGLENIFFKELLTNWDVAIQLDQREGYKSVFESFTQEKFSKESRENLQSIINDFTNQICSEIAASRATTQDQIKTLLDNAPYTDKEALSHKLVDQLAYADDVYDAIESELKVKPNYVSLAYYYNEVGSPKGNDTIALIFVDGGINALYSDNSPSFEETTTPRDIIKLIKDATKDAKVKAIVLRINSPGGVASSAEAIWHAVTQAKKSNKPVIVSMGAYAASAGYMIAAPATKIIATPATLTGSIGVASGKFSVEGTLNKLGIKTDKILGSKNADFWSLTSKFSPEQWQKLQNSLDAIYQSFMAKVAEGRNMNLNQVRKIAQGQVWSGKQAKEIGLVDELGGILEAIEAAKAQANLTQVQDVTLKVMNRHNMRFTPKDLLGTSSEFVSKLGHTVALLNMPQQRYPLPDIR